MMHTETLLQMKELFDEQQKLINTFFNTVDVSQVEKFFQACLECKGLLIFSGVGKSGIVAEKIAMTLTSTGTRSIYLPIGDYLHGDIGMVKAEDTVVLMSKSGETKELLDIVPFIRQKGAKILSIQSALGSRLEVVSDCSLCLPVERELCPFGLSPTTSTAVQLIFGDILSVALMRAKEFKLEDYANNHPSGTIGLKLTLKVSDLMITGEGVPVCHKSDKLRDILPDLSAKRCGCMIVTDHQHALQGIFTDGDLRRALQAKGELVLGEELQNIMTHTALSVPSNILVVKALALMQANPAKWITALPVVDDGRVIGLLRMHDIIHVGILSAENIHLLEQN